MIQHYLDEENKIVELTIAGNIGRGELTKVWQEIEGPLNIWSEVRILKRVDSFSGIEFMALIDDIKFVYNNFKNLKKVKKVAIVTDKDWIEDMSGFINSITSAEIKVFEGDDIEKARTWLR